MFLFLFNWENALSNVPISAALVQTVLTGANRYQEVLVSGFAATWKYSRLRRIAPIRKREYTSLHNTVKCTAIWLFATIALIEWSAASARLSPRLDHVREGLWLISWL